MDFTDNAFQSPGFPSDPAQAPDASSPKTIGILNIIFSCVLLLCGTCGTFYAMFFTFAGPFMQANAGQMQQAMEDARDRQLDQLDTRIEATEDEERKQELQDRRDRLAAQPVKTPDITKMYGMSDPRVSGYYLTDLLSGLLLNVGLLISGIGLVGLKEWGRRWGLWVARLKLLRLLVLYSVFLAMILPVQVRLMQEGFREIGAMGNGQEVPDVVPAMATGMSYTLGGWAVATLILGAIYPLIMWLVLRRESVKAACTQQPPAPYAY
jgi:hypothetical protein